MVTEGETTKVRYWVVTADNGNGYTLDIVEQVLAGLDAAIIAAQKVRRRKPRIYRVETIERVTLVRETV